MQHDAVNLVTPVLERIDGVLGDRYDALIYGSAAREEFRSGVSDINLLLVCEDLGPEVLRRLSSALRGLRREWQAPPLLVTQEEWAAATDVFPIEVTDMRIAHLLLRGNDPVAGRVVAAGDLRRALETELRAKLVRLRQAYVLEGTEPRTLGQLASGTVASVASLLRVALFLLRGSAPVATPAALAAAGAAMGVSTAPVAQLWERRSADGPPCDPALFEGYLTAVTAAVHAVDSFSPGGQ